MEARRRSDGLVLASPRAPDERLRALSDRLAPLVLLYREIPGSTLPSLSIDNAAGIAEIMDHLTGLGHRRLVYLAGPEASAPNRDRRAALRAIVAATPGLTLTELPCGAMFDDGHAVARQVVACRATGVIAFNDMAPSALLSGSAQPGVAAPVDCRSPGSTTPLRQFTPHRR